MDTKVIDKLQKQNAAWNIVLAAVETAIFNVKIPKDNLHSDVYLKQLQDDLNTILELHNGKLGAQKSYVVMRGQNRGLKKKLDRLEDIEDKNDDRTDKD